MFFLTQKLIRHNSSFGRTKTKFLPYVSCFVLSFHVPADDPGLISEHLAGRGFDSLPQNKDSVEAGGRERHPWGHRGGHACLL